MTLHYTCDEPGCTATAPAEGRGRTLPTGWRPYLEEDRKGQAIMLDRCETCEKRRRAAKENGNAM